MERTEAIEVIRENWPDASFTQLREALETLIPELSESEDERIRKAIVYAIGQSAHSDGTLINGVSSEEALAWLERQKPAEWSEEDERAIDRACVALRAYSNGDLPEFLPSELLNYADRLQSLRPQPKQELSEEEQQIIEDAACAILRFSDTVETKQEEEELCKLASKLQDLKPKSHWRPSKEQMRFLLAVINNPNNAGAESCHLMLQSLYTDLQKLL